MINESSSCWLKWWWHFFSHSRRSTLTKFENARPFQPNTMQLHTRRDSFLLGIEIENLIIACGVTLPFSSQLRSVRRTCKKIANLCKKWLMSCTRRVLRRNRINKKRRSGEKWKVARRRKWACNGLDICTRETIARFNRPTESQEKRRFFFSLWIFSLPVPRRCVVWCWPQLLSNTHPVRPC